MSEQRAEHPMLSEIVVDNFACGGGASTGIEAALGRPVDHAINHNAKALAVHKANHPHTYHWHEDIRDLDPRRVGRGSNVGLAWFSPDCTYHSKARGGKPFRDRNRARRVRGLGWSVVHWAKVRRPRVMMLENVEEFSDWGPLLENGRPDPARRGQTFRKWHRMIENLGYQIDMRELRACDYGAPTSRKRLFVVMRRDGEEIVFPEPSHGHGALPYRTAAECIDWTIPCPSIFNRKRPLAEATMRRIARGIMRYVVNNPKPFIVTMRGTDEAHIDRSAYPVDEPLRTLSASGTHHAVVTPFLTEHANASHQRNFPADEPLRTQCANVKGGHFALVAPTLINTRNGERQGQAPRIRSIEQPYPTITAVGSQGALVAAFLARGHENDGASLRVPMHTITTQDHHALVHAFLVAYYGNDKDGQALSDPLRTVTTKDRLGLVTVHVAQYAIADIGMRMLQPNELKLAQSFPPDYILDPEYEGKPLTKTDQVWMLGNSVPPVAAEALVRANMVEPMTEERAA